MNATRSVVGTVFFLTACVGLVMGCSSPRATTAQTLTTSSAGPATGLHTHMITLTVANLTSLKNGTMVEVLSTNVSQHTHTYRIRCT